MSNINDREILPSPLRDEPITAAIAGSLHALADEARRTVASAEAQMSPATATWGLEAWEKMTGIVPETGTSPEDRRAAVVARLCGRGTADAEAIARLAASLTGFGAEVQEDFGDYSFSLTLLGDEAGFTGMDLTLLIKAVEELKPAHLRFVLPHVRWRDIEARGMTWADMEEAFHTWAELEAKHPVEAKDKDGPQKAAEEEE